MTTIKPCKIMFDKNGRKVHIYSSGEVYVKDAYSTLGRYVFPSATAATHYYRQLGYR